MKRHVDRARRNQLREHRKARSGRIRADREQRVDRLEGPPEHGDILGRRQSDLVGRGAGELQSGSRGDERREDIAEPGWSGAKRQCSHDPNAVLDCERRSERRRNTAPRVADHADLWGADSEVLAHKLPRLSLDRLSGLHELESPLAQPVAQNEGVRIVHADGDELGRRRLIRTTVEVLVAQWVEHAAAGPRTVEREHRPSGRRKGVG